MNADDLGATLNLVNQHVDAILRGRARLRGIHQVASERAERPFEQDLIYGRHYGAVPIAPREKVIHGVKVTTRVLHQEGLRLSDIAGADLLYEIEDTKYVVIQYKRVRNGRITNDREQLKELIDGCPAQCYGPLLGALWCGSWVGVDAGTEHLVMPACVAEEEFAGRGSVNLSQLGRALTHDAFDELFAKCFAGARVAFAPTTYIQEHSVAASRIVFAVSEAI